MPESVSRFWDLVSHNISTMSTGGCGESKSPRYLMICQVVFLTDSVAPLAADLLMD